MFSFLPRTSALGLVAILFAAGCASSPSMQSSSAMPAHNAVMMSSTHGSVMFIKSADPDKPTVLASSGAVMCEKCKADAIAYFKTGKIDPTCPECGATRTTVAMAEPTIGHQ